MTTRPATTPPSDPDLAAPHELRLLSQERSAEEIVKLAERARRTGGCERPIRLKALGAGSPSVGEPDQVLLVACKSRRESRCVPCATTYRGDARHLVRAGIEGGKGVPESVSSHPAVMVTLTAPSFGAVHRAVDGRCHLGPPGRCLHGRPRHCLQRHDEQEEIVGSPLCPDCYDYEQAVLFNASAGELWRRVTIYARRHLAYLLGVPERLLKDEIRLSYLKVAELQRRGVVHLHAIVRADAAGDEMLPPPVAVTSEILSRALVKAVRAVSLSVEVDDRTHLLSFGEQLSIEPITTGEVAGLASYLAKYLTKEASGNGSLDHRLREGEIDLLDLPEHVRAVVETAWRLGSIPELTRLRRFAHALGYSGHLMTKSRRYSTTFKALREERRRWRLERAGIGPASLEHADLRWSYEGTGYRKEIDAVLAATEADNRRESRRAAYEARSDTLWEAVA